MDNQHDPGVGEVRGYRGQFSYFPHIVLIAKCDELSRRVGQLLEKVSHIAEPCRVWINIRGKRCRLAKLFEERDRVVGRAVISHDEFVRQ